MAVGFNKSELQIVVFKLGAEEYGVEIGKVQEIIKLSDITFVPGSPPYVEGVINLRGKVIPVINLKKKFNLGEEEITSLSRIIIARIGERLVGFKVDAALEVLRLNQELIEPPPEMVQTPLESYIMGVGKSDNRLIVLLDLEKLLTESEKENLAHLEEG